MKSKSILIDWKNHRDLKKLAKEHSRGIGQFTVEMIVYFRKTGTDPRAINGKSTTEMIKVIDRRIVSFFKTQEADILYPMQNKIQENGIKTEELFNKLINELKRIFEKIRQNN